MYDTHTPEMSAEIFANVVEMATRQGFREMAECRMAMMSFPEQLAYNWGMIDMEAAIVLKFACQITKEIYQYSQPIAA